MTQHPFNSWAENRWPKTRNPAESFLGLFASSATARPAKQGGIPEEDERKLRAGELVAVSGLLGNRVPRLGFGLAWETAWFWVPCFAYPKGPTPTRGSLTRVTVERLLLALVDLLGIQPPSCHKNYSVPQACAIETKGGES